MQRRKFFQYLGSMAAGSALWPLSGTRSPAAGFSAAPPSQAAAGGFDHYTQDYAQFCATPANERIFYALRDGQIVAEKLDNQNWKPEGWGKPPELPVPGGSHDGVPMNSPIPGLAGEGRVLAVAGEDGSFDVDQADGVWGGAAL